MNAPGPRDGLPNGGESEAYEEAKRRRAKVDKAQKAERKRQERIAKYNEAVAKHRRRQK